MRKTWTSLLVAVAMVLGLCACGGSTGDGEHEATAPMTAASASAPARESDTGSYSEVAKLGLVGMAWTDARKVLKHAHIDKGEYTVETSDGKQSGRSPTGSSNQCRMTMVPHGFCSYMNPQRIGPPVTSLPKRNGA